MADDNFEEDIFDDLYDEEPTSNPLAAAPVAAPKNVPEPALAEPAIAAVPDPVQNGDDASWRAPAAADDDSTMDHSGADARVNQPVENNPMEDDNYGPINVKEDG